MAMGTKLKWIMGIGVALIVALIVALYVILSVYDFNNLKPQIAKAARDATGRELTIGGDIDLDIGLTPALVLTDIKFQNAPWGSRPELFKVGRFEVKVALLPLLGGKIEIKRFILIEPDILVETDKYGRSNLAFETPKKTVPPQQEEKVSPEGITKLPALIFNKLQIEKGRLAYRDGQSGKTYEVMLDRLTASAAGIDSPVEITLKGAFNKEPLDITGTLGPLTELLNPEKPWSIDLTARGFNATVALDGAIKNALTRPGIDLGFTIQAQNLKKLSRLAGKPLPLNEPLEIAGHVVETGPKTYKISDLKVTLGSNDLSGSVEINLAKKLPLLTAMLSSEKLDLRPLLPERKEKGKAEAKPEKPVKRPKRIFPDDPLLLDALEQVEGIVKVQAGRILLPKLAINDLTAYIILKRGRLDVRLIKAAIGHGTLNGHIALESREKGAAMAIQLKAEGFELGTMLKELNITDVLEGNLDVDINLEGRGGSVAKVMANLHGHTSIIMSNGRIKNKYIDLLGDDFSTSVFRLFNPVKKKVDYTEINCLVSRFDIKKGLAKSTALVFDTGRMGVIGEGKIDLKSEKLDLSLKPVPKGGVGFSGLGKLGLSLGELAKPFKLGGTLAEPSLAIDPRQAAITLGKAIGGVALFGPVGIAAALLSGSSDDKNPCLAAIEIAKTGVKAQKNEKTAKKRKIVKETTDDVNEGIQRVKNKLKKLFGK